MTDKPAPLSTLPAVPSQTILAVPPPDPTVKDDLVPQKVEPVEEEPYTIKCICDFSDDDGNTIYCDTCDTWQHIECFYPDNREEAIREDFTHSCADCKPRPLNRQKAKERALQLKRPAALGPDSLDKKTKRPPSKSSHKKKPKPADVHVNGYHSAQENGKHESPTDHGPASKKSKSSHRPTQSLGSHPSKRSPSYGNSRQNAAHPLSPANTPPDLPQNFPIHHYSDKFYSLYTLKEVPDTHNNPFASLAIPTALARWLREPDAMKQETGCTHAEVFQDGPPSAGDQGPKLKVEDATRTVDENTTIRWRFIKSTSPVDKDVPLIELNGEIGFQNDYCAQPDNFWADLSSPLPFVFFHPFLPLYIDTRKEGSIARYVRRSCKPNAQLDTYLSGGSEYHFWLVSDRHIAANEQITLPWDFRLEKSIGARWLHLLGLSDDEANGHDESELDHTEYLAISSWIDRILSEYGGCACGLDNNCAFARFHRQYLFGKQARSNAKRKHRKVRNHTVSPTSTGHATNSRAASEGHGDDTMDDTVSQSGSSRSKPPSRDRTPMRQGSLDRPGILTEPTDRDKRKVAMVEDSFRRMEQQPPLKKKKRASDGTTTSSSSRPNVRHGSAVLFGSYVDAGTSRSKSGSPSSAHSPTFTNGFKPSLSRHESTTDDRSRHTSTGPRASYCDAAVQTDPVQGEWFAKPTGSPQPRKRIISLSRRLLNSKHRSRVNEEQRRSQSYAPQSLPGIAMEIQSPTMAHKPLATPGDDAQQATSQTSDVHMPDAPPPAPLVTADDTPDSAAAKIKTPDLRVLMPPAPTFDNSALAGPIVTTPQSAASSIPQSPFSSTTLPNAFAPPAVNGIASQPSPAKKKLSLSDYKSRMNKTAKVAGGNAILKTSLLSPEETKVDITLDGQPSDKAEDGVAPSTAPPATNGA